MNTFYAGFVTAIISMYAAVWLQVEFVDKNKPVTPIGLHCPDNTKQIIIPDASKLGI